ncbi:response regulator [Geothrix sp.]|jgi:CheY-like chemotaxis protein|uniref:response regulator n=1 Tax=Geothrix sp. TaxID=1962974 RepID=UPI0025C0CA2D|nr:response regulator [Geothrix sp.]
MPRLLLVDDNPSIHRIAESLLAHTDVELVCVDSAAEALDRIARGERFDVALVDTAMPGMDGWTLLGRLRAMPETAHLPIALMAGVLDPVDPSKLAKAPVQGFLKKPIELRELGDRVKALLATPVVSTPEPSAFTTVPATSAKDLVRMAEASLPEFRPEAAPVEAHPTQDLDLPATEDDLLVLTAEDLWPEEAPVAPGAGEVDAAAPEIHLELEELDLESLQDLAAEPVMPVPEVVEPLAAHPEDPAAPDAAALVELPVDEDTVTLSGLEALDVFPTDMDLPPLPEVEPPAKAAGFSSGMAAMGATGLAAAAAALLGETHEPVFPQAVAPVPAIPEPAPEPVAEPAPEAAIMAAPAAAGQAPAVAGQPAVPSEQAQALVQALLADPVLVDALVKAVVARMGDQVVREIAWEVMPDLAGRLQR